MQTDRIRIEEEEGKTEDRTNVLILSSDRYKLFYDKCYTIAERKYNPAKFNEITSFLVKAGYTPAKSGDYESLHKSELYIDTYFSQNKREKTMKFQFQFSEGFNPLKIQNYASNWIINNIRDNIKNWKIYSDLELTLGPQENGEVPLLHLLWDLDKCLNSIYDIENKFMKLVYVKGYWVKLYYDPKEGKNPRLEIQTTKEANDPFEVFNYIIHEKQRLATTEYRNELHFENIDTTLKEIKEKSDKSGIPTEILMKFIEIAEKMVGVPAVIEKISNNQDLTANLLINQIDHLSNQNIETQVMIRTNGFWFKVKNFFRKLRKRLFGGKPE